MVVALALLIFVVAIASSMFGLGGGVLFTPLQTWIGVEFHLAAATSLFLIMVVSFSASLVYRKAKKIDWPLTIVLELSTGLGGFVGGFSSSRWSVSSLKLLFSLVVVTAGILMLRPLVASAAAARQATASKNRLAGRFIWDRNVGGQRYRVNLTLALPLSFLAGLLSGMLGVGGGVLKVPMLVLIFGIPLDIAIGSSAFMIGITATCGLAGHLVHGYMDWKQSLMLAAVVFAGGQIGSRISIRLDKRKLKRGFGYLLIGVAVVMFINALRQI